MHLFLDFADANVRGHGSDFANSAAQILRDESASLLKINSCACSDKGCMYLEDLEPCAFDCISSARSAPAPVCEVGRSRVRMVSGWSRGGLGMVGMDAVNAVDAVDGRDRRDSWDSWDGSECRGGWMRLGWPYPATPTRPTQIGNPCPGQHLCNLFLPCVVVESCAY